MRIVDDIPMYAYNGSTCFICGCGKHEGEAGVIDLDRNVDMEGDIYMCIACGLDLAHLLDCSSPSQTARYQGQIRNQADEIAALKAKLASVEGRILEAIQ